MYGTTWYRLDDENKNLGYVWYKESDLVKVAAMDTGGYTGDWNTSEGRLAMLHEKEIVLNKTDTANILNAVDVVRSLETSMLSSLAAMAPTTGSHF
jgi:hypothetical protein